MRVPSFCFIVVTLFLLMDFRQPASSPPPPIFVVVEESVQEWKSFNHAINVTFIDIPRTLGSSWQEISAAAEGEGLLMNGDRSGVITFFVVDVESESSYGHWQGESAVFLHEWRNLKKWFRNVFVLIGSPRNYKKITFELYEIFPHDVKLLSELPNYPHNYCVFKPLFSLSDRELDQTNVMFYWHRHIEFLEKAALQNSARPRKYPLLIMPRGVNENIRGNDRAYPGFEIISLWAQSVGGQTLFTDNITSFRKQILLLMGARIVVLTEGSCYSVNGAFVTNSVIVIVGKSLVHQRSQLPSVAAHDHFIRHINNNTLYEVSNATEVIPLLCRLFNFISHFHTGCT